MRPSVPNRRDNTPTPQTQKKKTSSWRRQGAALLASLGLLSPMAAVPANANAMRQDPVATDPLIRTRADNCQNLGTAIAPPAPLKASFDRVSEGFARLEALPITGAPIVATLKNPVHRFQACLDPALPGNGILAAYSPDQNRLFLPQREFNFVSAVHEAYHAYQDAAGGLDDSGLYPRDTMISHLLTEAAAASYTLMVMRELAFYSDADATAYQAYIADRRNNFGMGLTFDAAFNTAYARDAALPEDQRRRRALEAGGQAAVSGLMAGAGENWRRGYAPRAVTASRAGTPEVNTTSRRYRQLRAEIYQRTGRVGNDIQIIPAQFYGANADANAQAALMILGIEAYDVPAAPPVPRGPHR